jgi:hypothetical protein
LQQANAAVTQYGVLRTSLLHQPARAVYDIAKYGVEWHKSMGDGGYMFPQEDKVSDINMKLMGKS